MLTLDRSAQPPPSGNDVYHSRFTNEAGVTREFRYDPASKQGWLCCDEEGLGEHLVVGSFPQGIRMTPAEQMWLIAAWSAATGSPLQETRARHFEEAFRSLREEQQEGEDAEAVLI